VGQLGEVFAGRLFNRRLEKCRDKLYRMAYAWCHNRYLAEDLTQQALLKAIEKQAQLRDVEKLEQWVFQILANALRDWHRRERPLESLDDHEPVAIGGPEHNAAQDQIVVKVRQAVGKLPLAQRQVITLVDLEGFSYADVSQVLEIPMGTVMSRLSRARKALKEHLEKMALVSRSGLAEDATGVRPFRVVK